jgi:hypothetical protein
MNRSALTWLEFLGCLIAVFGGIWLGAYCIGVDVRHLAYVALSESELLEQVPEGWRPEDPSSANSPTPAELAQAVQQELVALRHEINALRTTRGGARVNDASTAAGDDSEIDSRVDVPPAKSTTLAYWNRVHDVVRGEIALQIDAESAATTGNATKVAALKGRISRFAASAIRAIPIDGVDPTAVQISRELAHWYDQSGNLYELAVRLWESPGRGKKNLAMSKEWEHAQSQHRNEGQLMNDKIAAARDSLTRLFGEGFTPFVAF